MAKPWVFDNLTSIYRGNKEKKLITFHYNGKVLEILAENLDVNIITTV